MTLADRLARSLVCAAATMLTLLWPAAHAHAQLVVHESGIKAGLTFATLTSSADEGAAVETGNRKGFSGGVFAARHLQPRLLAQVEGLVTIKGVVRPGERLRATYLEVPALAKYVFAPSGTADQTFFVVAGPSLALRLSATLNRDDGRSEDAGAEFRALDLGLHVGGGIERNGVLFEVRYARSLIDVRSDRESGAAAHHRTLTFLAGLRIPR